MNETIKMNSWNDSEWLMLFYEQVGREASSARESQRETHNWVITLAAGIVTAVLALGGDELKYPSELSFVGLLIVIPLFFRFFVRSCLEYQIFNRWIILRNGLDGYFIAKQASKDSGDKAMKYLEEIIQLYYFQWKAPKPIPKMIADNLKLAYGWPFIILFVLLVWGIIAQTMTTLICYTLIVFIPWMFLEINWFIGYRGFKYQEPSIKFDATKLLNGPNSPTLNNSTE